MHLVFVSERVEGRVPALAEVRDAVRREWDEARRLEANEKFYQELLKHYTVTIEKPEPEEANNVAARSEMKRALLILVLLVALAPVRVRARGASRVSRIAPDRAGNLRRAVESAWPGRLAPRTLRGTARRAAPTSPSHAVRWSTMPIPNAGP